MYTSINFKTKKAFKEAFKKYQEEVEKGNPNPPPLYVYQSNEMFPHNPNGEVSIEGPHFPKAHTWYARVEIKNDKIVRIIS